MPTKRYKIFITFAPIAVIILGTSSVFYNWFIQLKLLNKAVESRFPMATDTAVCFILTGFAMLLRVFQKKIGIIAARLALAATFICALLSLLQDVSIIKDPISMGMAPQTAFSFICISAALYILQPDKKNHTPQWLFHFVTLMACVVLIGHALSIPEFYSLMFIPMTAYSAFCFLLLSVSASFLNPSIGITGLFTGNLIGNLMARRLFFLMFGAILVAGYIRITSHRMNLIGVEFGVALHSLTFCLITLVLIWIVSTVLNKAHQKVNIAKDNLHSMVHAAPYALLISDKNGSILEVNEKTEHMLGYPEGELVGKNVSVLVPESMREIWMERRSAFLSDPITSSYGFDDEIMAVRKNGRVLPVEITLTPINIAGDVRILSFVVDITTRKANEATITRQVTELQHKNEELEQFNYISSHDLQEPLRTVSNYINLLEEDYPDQVYGEVKEHLQSIDSAVTRMLKLVRSLLEFGKLGKDRKMSLIDSQAVVNDVLADLKGLIAANNATVSVNGELPKLYAYETELRQLLQNLINNAVKFKKEQIQPHIIISCKNIEGYFRFAVADNGVGIAPEHKAKIFNIFQRLHSKEAYEGHGIGLANCKKIAELHGGKIWVESEPGKGSTFKFTILKFKV